MTKPNVESGPIMPWDHEATSWFGEPWHVLTWYRWPRLCNLIKRTAVLSNGETAAVVRALKDRHMPVGEAIMHYAGATGHMDDQSAARVVVRSALKGRSRHRKAFGEYV